MAKRQIAGLRLVGFLTLFGMVGPMSHTSLAQKTLYLEKIRESAEKGWKEYPGWIEQWKKSAKTSVLWGYDAPGAPPYLAAVLGFLYEETRNREYARRAAEILLNYGRLRSELPKGYENTRAEYKEGVPAISNFFFMAPYIRAYLRVKDAGVLNPEARRIVERDVAGSADFIFHFPEWGAHNRAILRAEALLYAALAIPDHPNAGKWRKMANVIARDNLHSWEIEDATGYHGVWLLSLYSYAEASGNTEFFDSPITHYYLDYYLRLIGPQGTIPEFGDSRWNSGWESLRFVPVFERGAAVRKDPELKWAAKTIFERRPRSSAILSVSEGYSLSEAYRWCDETIQPRQPQSLSQEVLDDVVGKKIVFRNGWTEGSTYMLLNYRDEGDGGYQSREFLRRTISVEEEKMHHGHSDENSIALLMKNGSVLLHDGDYRSDLPSGPYGAWRQDYFHNRLVTRLNKRDPRQTVLEFVRNSGAYRTVRTQKVDFLSLQDVDMSRTRLIDEVLGYQWDRAVTYLRGQDFFVVVDGIKILRSDYFTFVNFWHGQQILEKGDDYVVLATDSVPGFHFSQDQALIVYFPETYGKSAGSEQINRSRQTEWAVYQTQSSHYKAGDTEVFVTVLYPVSRRSIDAKKIRSSINVVRSSKPYRAVGVEIREDGTVTTLGVKIDLEMDLARENIRPRYLYDLGRVQYGEFETDADFLCATASGKSVKYSASNVLRVIHKGKTLMEALPNTHGLQLDGTSERIGFAKWRLWEDDILDQ
ncbi:MAG: hypothetical protein HBSIN02_10640 [Bacteroidia bacterium]|nr:MAG: hypothetical protein HBSIN02_10640 [Bacteroidia bacterium]